MTSTAAGRPRSNGRLPAMAGSVPGAMVNAAPRAPEMTLLRRHVSSADRFLLAPPPVPRTPRFAAEVAAVALVPALLLGVLFGAPAFWAWLVLLVVAGVASPFALRAWRERHSGDIVRVPPTRLGRHLAALLPHAEQAFEVLDRYPGARTRELSRLLDQALLDFALDTVRVHEASVGVETLLDRILEHRRTHLITDHPVTRDALRVFADADAVLAESARKLWRAIDRVIDATLISTPEAVADAGQHLEATLEGLQVADLAISTDARQTLSMVAGMEGYDPPASGGAAPQSVTGPDGNREPRRIDLTKPDDRLVP